MTSANQLSKMSAQALSQGDVAGAQTLAEAALTNDPHNPQATILHEASAHRGSTTTDIRVAQIPTGNFLDSAASGLPAPGGPLNGGVAESPLILQGGPVVQTPEQPDGELLRQVEARRRAKQDALRVEVRSALSAARDTLSTDPEEAVSNLKLVMQDVRQVTGIDDEVRSQLVDQIESAIREGERRRVEKDRLDAEAAENLAIARERQRILEGLERREARQEQIFERFNALMDEGNYLETLGAVRSQP